MNDDEEEELIIAAMIHFANVMFDFEDEDEAIMQGRVRAVGPWVKVNVDVSMFMNLPDLTFKMHFRMGRTVFEELCIVVGNHLQRMGRRQRLRTSLDKALLMVLWVLGNPDPFRSIALQFGVSPGVVHFHYLLIIEALTELSEVYITWPSAAKRARTKEYLERKFGFPGVVGAIDATHLYLTAPAEDRLAYLNRHHSYSIVAQVVCDENLLVIDLHAGEPGSLHDARTFRRSPLCEKMLVNDGLFEEDEVLLGDGGYVLTDKLLVPFRNNGRLTRAQVYFNYMLSRVRAMVERCFGRAKGKMRRMRNFESHEIEYAVEHVVASFVIHNFIILNGENDDNDYYPEPNQNGHDVGGEDVLGAGVVQDHPLLEEARAAGAFKRHILTNYFQTGYLPNL